MGGSDAGRPRPRNVAPAPHRAQHRQKAPGAPAAPARGSCRRSQGKDPGDPAVRPDTKRSAHRAARRTCGVKSCLFSSSPRAFQAQVPGQEPPLLPVPQGVGQARGTQAQAAHAPQPHEMWRTQAPHGVLLRFRLTPGTWESWSQLLFCPVDGTGTFTNSLAESLDAQPEAASIALLPLFFSKRPESWHSQEGAALLGIWGHC